MVLRMNISGQRVAVVCGAALILAASAGHLFADNEYTAIVERNAFGLSDPPPPPPPQPKPEKPKPASTVILTGITTMFSKARAFFEIETPGEQKQKPILRVGEREGDLQLVSIDVENNSVVINNAGEETKLVLEPHKKKAPATANRLAPGIRPGMPRPGIRLPTAAHTASSHSPTVISPGSSSSSGNVVVAGGSNSSSETATPASRAAAAAAARRMPYRLPPTTTRSTSSAGNISVSGGGSSASTLRTIPTRSTRTQSRAPTTKIDPAQQYLLMKANEMKARNEGTAFPPMPVPVQLQAEQ